MNRHIMPISVILAGIFILCILHYVGNLYSPLVYYWVISVSVFLVIPLNVYNDSPLLLQLFALALVDKLVHVTS